ncbi:MAG: ThuA domain-containing protein [Verrucomicrobiae bacterium]|nr:ThuA domain-containing protein [Verrucomicrobiae bacterium]MCP5550145.1 ThuA domain-containing protein [Akkermansiaceae bacterium]
MKSLKTLLPLAALACVAIALPLTTAQDQKPAGDGKKEKAAPLRALLVTGGCCHDYDAQKTILMAGIGERTPVKWDFVYEQYDGKEHRIGIYNDPDWAMGYDVVVHNECYGAVADDDFVNQITAGHLKAKAAAVFLHCSMHSYRAAATNEYRKLIGVSSFNHGAKNPIAVTKLASHPVIDPVPADWVTPNGELYNTNPKTHPDAKIWDSATALAQGKVVSTPEPQICVWVNEYEGVRTFGTTIGHHNETMADPVYLDLVTRGVLWATGRLGN